MKKYRIFSLIGLFLGVSFLILSYVKIDNTLNKVYESQSITDGITNISKDQSKETYRFSRLFLRLVLTNNSDMMKSFAQYIFLNVLDTDYDGWLTFYEAQHRFKELELENLFEYYFKYEFGDEAMDLPMFVKIFDKMLDR